MHAKVKEGRFNIGPSEQETLGRRWHDVELASGATFFHDMCSLWNMPHTVAANNIQLSDGATQDFISLMNYS